MLELYSDVFLYRGMERLLVVVGGLFFGYLGYKLFIFGVNEGNGKLETESQLFKLTFSGSGPGLFFMAFGALVLVFSIFSSATATQEVNTDVSQQLTKGEAETQSKAKTTNTDSAHASLTANKLQYSNDANAGACDKIRFADLGSDTLWAYQNAIAGSKAENQLRDLAKVIEITIEDINKQKSLLEAIEQLVCRLER